jgi:hypothetical protein
MENVGLSGFEPPTSRLSGVRSYQLSYRPNTAFVGPSTRRRAPSPTQRIIRKSRANFPRIFALLRKEVIQPHVPVRLPCYDFTPITDHAFGTCLLAVSLVTSGTTSFRDVTGGVYKARERIHRGVADPRLLAIPASWRRIAASNPN